MFHLKYMRYYDKEELNPVFELSNLIEKIVTSRNLNKYFHRIEIEKILFSLFEGKDKINPYERRECGVDDYVWQETIKKALYFLNLRKSYEKIYKE